MLAREDEEMKFENASFGSFFIWRKEKVYDVKDLDPNYISKPMFDSAPFYIALKKWLWGIRQGQTPFHIDVHGKYDRKDDLLIDLGTVSIGVEFPDEN